jgi:hypothetical protein
VKAVVYDTYGSPDVLELREIDQPLVRDDQVLVRVCATSLNAAVLRRGPDFLTEVPPVRDGRSPSRYVAAAEHHAKQS